MLARPLRTKRKSASAQRYLRSLGATIDMANLIMRPSKGSSQRRIVAWMFTKSQLGDRRGYWVWSLSGNCCSLSIFIYHFWQRKDFWRKSANLELSEVIKISIWDAFDIQIHGSPLDLQV